MAISRRDFVGRAGTAAILGSVARRSSPIAQSDEPQQTSGVWIDGLSGTRLGPEGLAEIAKSGLTVMETTLGPAGNPTFSYEAAVQDLAEWHGNFARYSDKLLHIKRSADILQAKREGKMGVLLGFQNATHLNRDIRNVDFFYNLGIRQMQLTYNELNALGAGSTERKDVGLSDFGVAVVERMNEIGMLVDVSHTGVQSTLDAIEVSKKPILFSHSNCRALNDNPRCKTDEQIRKLAAKGGVMGITTVNFFVSKKPRSTLDDYIAHIEHVAKLVGIDHVGIGTDSSIGGWRIDFPDEKTFRDFHAQFKYKPGVDLRWPPFIEEIDVPDKMYIIQKRLASKGFSSTDIDKILGGNFFRVYKEIIG
ncbi:MAG TPA: membrane dipeptidase [Gemmatimonadales bacterium]|nr:membrane dipeptidase [Gemmatimonadales bacterium]